MLNNETPFNYAVEGIDDEIDCAIMSDPKFTEAIADMAAQQPTAEEEITTDESEDLVDTTIDYDGSIPGAGITDMDADDVLAAERDIMHDPFEDDELFDAAVGNDPEIDDVDLDDED